MFEDLTTPRARHWAIPALIGAAALVLGKNVLQPGAVAWLFLAGSVVFGAWASVNLVYHAAHIWASIAREGREIDFKLSANYLAETIAKMNSEQLKAIRVGRQVIEIIPGENGPVEKLWGEEVYMYMAWWILVNSDNTNLYPINRFQPGTFHYDVMGTHQVDDYQQARNFHHWLVLYGYAFWGRGNQSASWVKPYNADKVLGMLGMDRDTFRQEQ